MSDRAQSQFIWLTRGELTLLVVGAVGGIVTLEIGSAGVPLGAVIGLVAFAGAAALRAFVLAKRPERRWYEGRAAAESVKTLAWRYSVGGNPFGPGTDAAADELFTQRVDEVLGSLTQLEPDASDSPQITTAMRKLRAADLSERKREYAEKRITDQRAWYSTRAADNRQQAQLWGFTALGLQIAGFLAGLARLTEWIGISLLGVAAAAGGAVAAWLQTRQYEQLTTAYSVASQELASVQSLLEKPDTDQSWAEFVENAEEAISREHTLWRASRGLR